jgi:hypothetical protein
MLAHLAAAAAKLRNLAPYAAMELILPGGSLMALLFWLYRRQKMRGIGGASPDGRLLWVCLLRQPYVDLLLWVRKSVTCGCPFRP